MSETEPNKTASAQPLSTDGLEDFEKWWNDGYMLGAPVIDVKAIAREAWKVSMIKESYKCYSICQSIRMINHACAIEPSEAYDCEQKLIEQRPLLKALLSL